MRGWARLAAAMAVAVTLCMCGALPLFAAPDAGVSAPDIEARRQALLQQMLQDPSNLDVAFVLEFRVLTPPDTYTAFPETEDQFTTHDAGPLGILGGDDNPDVTADDFTIAPRQQRAAPGLRHGAGGESRGVPRRPGILPDGDGAGACDQLRPALRISGRRLLGDRRLHRHRRQNGTVGHNDQSHRHGSDQAGLLGIPAYPRSRFGRLQDHRSDRTDADVRRHGLRVRHPKREAFHLRPHLRRPTGQRHRSLRPQRIEPQRRSEQAAAGDLAARISRKRWRPKQRCVATNELLHQDDVQFRRVR